MAFDLVDFGGDTNRGWFMRFRKGLAMGEVGKHFNWQAATGRSGVDACIVTGTAWSVELLTRSETSTAFSAGHRFLSPASVS